MTQEELDAYLARIPYVAFLGMGARLEGGELTGVLPFSHRLIGNVMLPALHGGVLGAFMELTALARLTLDQPTGRRPKTIDVTIEYLRPGKPVETYAQATLRKVGRRIASVHAEAWQEARDQPVAALRGHFLLGEG